ncbi:MAG TPA: hypothetical protein VI792_03290 [Candidatus Eisenbacteria bacterium]
MAKTADTRRQQLADTCPQAKEPLEPAALNSLSEAVKGTVEELTGGQVDTSKMGLEDVTEEQDMMPTGLWSLVSGIGGLLQQHGDDPKISKYAFDPVEGSTSNKGLAELAMKIDRLGRDAKAVKLLQAGAKAQEATESDQQEGAEPAGMDQAEGE